MEPEGGVVDVALLGLEVAGEASERTIHGEAVGLCTLGPKLKTVMVSRACRILKGMLPLWLIRVN